MNVGTYEHVLGSFWAWRKDADTVLCRTVTSYAPHIGPITALGGAGDRMVSGSADETLRVYDLTRRRELGRLDKHRGTVTAVAVARDGRHMVTAAEDRTLCIWRTRDWECTRTLERVHGRGGALALALHPSGRAALTLGARGLVRLWDLVHGTLAAAVREDAAATALAWDAQGECYAVAADRRVALKAVAQPDAPRAVLEHPARVLALQALADGLLACGCADGRVYVWDTTDADAAAKPREVLEGHTARVRAMAYLAPVSGDADAAATLGAHKGLLLTTSTDGVLCLWSCDDWSLLTSEDCKLRIQAAHLASIVPSDLPPVFFVPDVKEELLDDDDDDAHMNDPAYDSDQEPAVKQEPVSDDEEEEAEEEEEEEEEEEGENEDEGEDEEM